MNAALKSTLVRFARGLPIVVVAALMSATATAPAHAAVTAFFSAGTTCGGAASALYTNGSTTQVSLCVTTTVESTCGYSIQVQAASAAESGLFRITNRAFGSGYPDPNYFGAVSYPVNINSPAATADFGATVNGAPVQPTANQLLATFDLTSASAAVLSTYVISTGSTFSSMSVDDPAQPGCGNAIDVLIPATFTLVVQQGSQSITFGAVPVVNVGGTGTVSATATSGLPVSFSAAPSSAGKCTVSGSTVMGVAAGTCTVFADQAGDANYAPAPQGVIAFMITSVATSPPSAPTNVSVVGGAGKATLSFSPPTSNGGAAIVNYTATCSASGQAIRTATGAGSPLDVNGLSAGVAYTCSVTANNGTYTGAASASAVVTPGQVVDLTPILMLLLE